LVQAALSEVVEKIVAHIDGRSATIDLPLGIRATAFQRRAWEALQTIPIGETRSYMEIARQIGQPSASRAVAQACASNPVAIMIPCIRVVRTHGSLGGYCCGIERKSEMLLREHDAAFAPAWHSIAIEVHSVKSAIFPMTNHRITTGADVDHDQCAPNRAR
jgi:O-6-methylguanine DNA methyltransferase